MQTFTLAPDTAAAMLQGIGVIVTIASLMPVAEGQVTSLSRSSTPGDELAAAQAYVTWYLMIACILAGVLLGYVINQSGQYGWLARIHSSEPTRPY